MVTNLHSVDISLVELARDRNTFQNLLLSPRVREEVMSGGKFGEGEGSWWARGTSVGQV